MHNIETQAAWGYHNATKHSLESVRTTRHLLDWSNQPRPYKLYKDLESLSLPQDMTISGFPALAAIAQVDIASEGESIPDLKTLASILHFSAGTTKRATIPGGRTAFRAAACTGALYHIDLYIVCGELPGLEAGVYHFGVHDARLRPLYSGDYRGVLLEATGGETRVADAPVTIVSSSTYWRNSWKYQSRTYRHCFWDSGTILANMLAVAFANGLPTLVIAGFIDDQVNHLLNVDDQREVVLNMVPLGYAPSMRPGTSPVADRLALETVPLSAREVDYPIIRKMHSASSLTSPEEVATWRGFIQPASLLTQPGEVVPLRPPEPVTTPKDGIERVIRRRGSSRRFQQVPITFEDLSTILSTVVRGIPADFLEPPGVALNDMYLIVNAVNGLQKGTYVFHSDRQGLELLRAGDFRQEAGSLDLGQELAGDAAVNIYFLADLAPILERFGNRGYRVAQLDASITAGKLYLAAYALRLGATGLTFFDDDVIRFFSPHAQGKSVMFLTALGIPANHQPM